jgi:hypothetical protein
MYFRRIATQRSVMAFSSFLLPFLAIAALFGAQPEDALACQLFSSSVPGLILPSTTPTPAARPARLKDFWSGKAEWVLDVTDTGLPVGESDTIDMGNGVFWSYLHASTQSAGVVDSCGAPVDFPGCLTRWVSTDGGAHFALAEPRCMLTCSSCPCDEGDMTNQQQYPRVVRTPGGTFYMVFEHGATTWYSSSFDGINWIRPRPVPGTGTWNLSEKTCIKAERIGSHPNATVDDDCMAGGPPGLYVTSGQIIIFEGLGQSPGSMGCFRSALGDVTYFRRCASNPLFTGASTYGPLDVFGGAANPYFDFRFVTSADVVRSDGYYYMSYEGSRGPALPGGRDDQYALGFARGLRLDGRWDKYPGNPVLSDVADNWGIGHADLLIVDGMTYMYTGTPQMTRGRYVLRFK